MNNSEIELRRKKSEEVRGFHERRAGASPLTLTRAATSPNGDVRLTGYACLTGVPYEIGGSLPYIETVRAGAFKRTLGEDPDTVLNLEHGSGGSSLPIARTKAGTLQLVEDAQGLAVTAYLDRGDPDVELLEAKFRSGALDGQMSFCFKVTSQVWSDDYSQRTITAVNLHRGDVSIVSHAASPTTSSTLTSVPKAARSVAPQALPDHLSRAKEQLLVMRGRAEGIAGQTRPLTPDEIWSAKYRGQLERMRKGER